MPFSFTFYIHSYYWKAFKNKINKLQTNAFRIDIVVFYCKNYLNNNLNLYSINLFEFVDLKFSAQRLKNGHLDKEQLEKLIIGNWHNFVTNFWCHKVDKQNLEKHKGAISLVPLQLFWDNFFLRIWIMHTSHYTSIRIGVQELCLPGHHLSDYSDPCWWVK